MAGQSRPRVRGATQSRAGLRDRDTAPLDALQGALETLGFVIDALTDGILLIDGRRRIVYANAAVRALLGAELDGLMGRTCESLFPPAGRARLRTQVTSWLETPGRAEVPLGHGSQEGLVLELNGVPLLTHSFSGALVMLTDVTANRVQQRQEAIAAAVQRGLGHGVTLADACQHLLRTLGEALNRPAGTVILLDGAADDGVTMYRWRAAIGRRGPFFGGERLPAVPGLAGRVIATGRPAWSSLEDEATSPVAGLAAGLASAHALPVPGSGNVLGALELFGPQTPGADAMLESLVLPVASAFGSYVRLLRATEQLGQVFEAVPVGLCLLSRAGRIERASPAFAGLLGGPPADGVGLELLELVGESDRGAVGRLWAEIHAGRRDRFDVEVRSSQPLVRPTWLRLVVSAGGTGPAESLVLAAEDVTERRLSAQSMQAAMTARSAAMSEMRRITERTTKSLSVVSHEFRTGLFGMQGYSEMLYRRELPAATVKAYAQSINADAKRMGRLINDLLDLERMQSGAEQLQLEEVEVAGLLSEAVERIRPSSDLHTFRLDLEDDLPGIQADRDRLAQVLGNLLSNAVKYSPRGGEVQVKAARHPDGVLIEVADQGIGIPPNLLESVFEEFTRTKDKSAIEGTGLGLPIVRHITRMHGGRVWADSVEGRGSVFHLVLPLAPPPPGVNGRGEGG